MADVPGNESARRRLRELLDRGEAVAFAGAGASAPLYPHWGSLIEQLVRATLEKGLASKDDARSWRGAAPAQHQQVVRSLRDRLTDGRVGNILSDLFRTRRGADGLTYTPIQRALIRANFRGYVSTHYDPGLLEARLALRPPRTATGFATWKDDAVHRWLTGDVFADESCPLLFAHGIHQRPDTILLGPGEYRASYENGAWRRGFRAIWSRETLVFCGFEADDPYLDFLADTVLKDDIADRDAPRHIALVPLKRGEKDSPAMRRAFRRRYSIEPLFLSAETNDDTTPLLDELEALASFGHVQTSPNAVGFITQTDSMGVEPIDITPPPPSRWYHETTEDPQYRGRRDAIDRLDRWCADASVRLMAITAFGGVGKTSLVGHWLKAARGWRHRPFDGLLFWSFYNERSVEALLMALVRFGAEELDAKAPEGTRLINAARGLLRTRRILLVLDGLEVLQEVADTPEYGALLEHDLRDLLVDSCTRGLGLVVLTSRFPFPELSRFYGVSARGFDLPPLSPADGANLLEACGVTGSTARLEEASEAYDGHPLALRIFAAAYREGKAGGKDHLKDVLAEAVRKAPEDAACSDVERRARKLKHLLAFYEKRLPARRKHLLSLVSLFRTPVEAAVLVPLARKLPELSEVFSGVSQEAIERELLSLVDEHLLTRQPGPSPDQPAFAAHPILRDYFRASLLDRRGEVAVDFAEMLVGQPSSNEAKSVGELQPVVDAIEALLEANLFERANDLYRSRLGGGQVFKWLPAPHAGMRCALGFVADELRQELCREKLGTGRLGFYLNEVGHYAKLAGEFEVSEKFLVRAVDVSHKNGTEKNTCIDLQNLADTLLMTGRLDDATARIEEALAIARKIHNPKETRDCLSLLAYALAMRGDLEAAVLQLVFSDEIDERSHVDYKSYHSIRIPLLGRRVWAWVGRAGHAGALTLKNKAHVAAKKRTVDIARCDFVLGLVGLAEGRPNEARGHLIQADEVLQPARQTADLADLHLAMATCHLALGDHAEAASAVDEAIALAAPRGMRQVLAEALALRATIRIGAWSAPSASPFSDETRIAARDDAEAALRIARDFGYRRAEHAALRILAGEHALGPHASEFALADDRLQGELTSAAIVADLHSEDTSPYQTLGEFRKPIWPLSKVAEIIELVLDEGRRGKQLATITRSLELTPNDWERLSPGHVQTSVDQYSGNLWFGLTLLSTLEEFRGRLATILAEDDGIKLHSLAAAVLKDFPWINDEDRRSFRFIDVSDDESDLARSREGIVNRQCETSPDSLPSRVDRILANVNALGSYAPVAEIHLQIDGFIVERTRLMPLLELVEEIASLMRPSARLLRAIDRMPTLEEGLESLEELIKSRNSTADFVAIPECIAAYREALEETQRDFRSLEIFEGRDFDEALTKILKDKLPPPSES